MHLAALLWALLFISIIGPAAAAKEAPPKTVELEQIVPPETFFFVKFPGIDHYLAHREALDLFKLWAEPEVQAFFAETKERIPMMLGKGMGKDPDFPVEKIWNLFRGEIALACSSRLTIFEEGLLPSMAMAVEIGRDREAFMGTLKGMMDMMAAQVPLERGHFDYRGFSVGYASCSWSRLAICHTTVKNLFVISMNRYYLQEIIDCHLDGKPVLAKDPSFIRCAGKVQGERGGMMAFLSLKPFLQMVKPFCPYEVESWLHMLGLDQVRAFAVGSTLEGGGSRESFFVDCPGEKRGLLKALAPRPISSENLRKAPPDTLFFMDMVIDPEMVLEEVDRFVKEGLPEYYGHFRGGLKQVRAETGFDLEGDILAPLGSEVTVYVTMPQTGAVVIPDVILGIDLDDEKGFMTLLERLLGMASRRIQVKSTDFEGWKLHHVVLPRNSVPIAPAFTMDHGRLLVATTPITLKKYLRWLKKDEPGLDRCEDFKAATAGISKKACFLKYVNLRRMVEIGYGMAAPFMPALIAECEMPLDAGLLPMPETLSRCISNGAGFMVLDEDGILMGGRSPVGSGALLAVFVSLGDYMVKEGLINGSLGMKGGRAVKLDLGDPPERGMKVEQKAQKVQKVEKAAAQGDDLAATVSALTQAGKFDEADQVITRWLRGHPGHERTTWALMQRGYSRLKLGRTEEGMADYAIVAEADERYRGLAFYNMACGASLLNQKDRAIKYLEKAFESGWRDIEHMESDSDLDNIRNDPRFKALMNKGI